MTITAERTAAAPPPAVGTAALGHRSEFDEVLAELMATRYRYDTTRAEGDAFAERARLLSALHELRARIALVRPVI